MDRLLIVDDEIRIREVIKEYGHLYNYEVEEACDGNEAVGMIEENDYDCVILDIMMPNQDGFTTCKKIKETKNVPIIMLSARGEEEDKLYCFELGVDDYVEKPFSPKELMARVKVVIDRNQKIKPRTDLIRIKGLLIDKKSHKVTIDDEEIHLTNKEYDMLVYLIENSNTVISREKLIENVWGYDSASSDRTVDTHIKMLRRSIGDYGKYIVTVRGVGYKFEKKE